MYGVCVTVHVSTMGMKWIDVTFDGSVALLNADTIDTYAYTFITTKHVVAGQGVRS